MRRNGSFADRIVAWLAAFLVLLALGLPAAAQTAASQDRGIGGTGVVPEDQLGGDRGIGGTGVIGTIRAFGSIVVSRMRITYAPDVPVRIDGRRASLRELKVGHVVRVVAERANGALATGQIDVVSEVVGPVERVSGTTLTVLGQTVATSALQERGRFRTGDFVAVNGLRRPNGTIVASLIESREPGPLRVAGPVARGPDGTLRIGRLALTGVDAGQAGQRLIVEGRVRGGRLDATSAQPDREPFGARVRRLSIESYVESSRNSLRLASGFALKGTAPASLPSGSSALAVVTAVRDAGGRLRLESLRVENAITAPPRATPPRRGALGDGRLAPGPLGTRATQPLPLDLRGRALEQSPLRSGAPVFGPLPGAPGVGIGILPSGGGFGAPTGGGPVGGGALGGGPVGGRGLGGGGPGVPLLRR